MFEHMDVRVRAGFILTSIAGDQKYMDVFLATIRGVLSFGYFSFAQAKKSDSRNSAKNSI